MSFLRILSRVVVSHRVGSGSRSTFTSSKRDTAHSNWLSVGLAFGSSVGLWALLFRQHSRDVQEYEATNALK
ncbi:NADH dehydrogenase [ubiquinone] 1 subunit C1, mitochondrial [Synchiropus splendidus]|uniref:NADH dehydrogenase [ubiquinone] 1 subunit C1, mitochondrial n=1 Tax=Synchiropus splendidus TaxID=270530 RepID=UPI00237DE770|nr:NADH dehydrogenase [ubiquinone] 1 subunit C1, mitochondrial [Synchiropus splendidus]